MPNYFLARFWTLFTLLFLAACTPKQPQQHQVAASSTFLGRHTSRRSFLEDAKQLDTLIPLGFRCTEKRLCSSQDSQLLVIRYEGMQPLTKVISFYQRELEAAGWDLINFSSDQEGLFFCHKGGQECAITISIKGKTIISFVYKAKHRIPERQGADISRINQPLREGNNP